MKIFLYALLLLLLLNSRGFAADISAIFTHNINNITFSKSTGFSEYYTFQTTKNDISFALHLTSNAYNYFYIEELISPSGEKIVTKNPEGVSQEHMNSEYVAGRGQILSPNGQGYAVFPGIVSMIVPNHPEVTVGEGEWKVRFAVEKKADRDLEQDIKANVGIVFKVKTHTGMVKNRRIDVNIYATNAAGIGQSIQDIERNLSEALAFFDSIGVEVKIRNFKIISEEYNHISDRINESDEKYQRFKKLWQGEESIFRDSGFRDIDIFFVKGNNYIDGGIAQIRGASLSMIDKKALNGVLIAVKNSRGLNLKFAHELCHHLGLEHTREDTLSDTESVDHIFLDYQGMQRNLMNVNADRFYLSPQQLNIIYNNPAVNDQN